MKTLDRLAPSLYYNDMGTEEAVEILVDAERQVRALLARAAECGDYDAVLSLNELARGVAALVDQHGQNAVSAHRRPTGAAAVGSEMPPTPPQAGTPSASARKRRTKRRRGYPKFARNGDDLVKTAWSKRQKKEYRHRAPRTVIEVLVTGIGRLGSTGLISTEELFPLTDPVDGNEVPSYQAYLCLAWLREEGLIEKRGRQGYAVASTDDMMPLVQMRWERLPVVA